MADATKNHQASLSFDDPFTPTSARFREGDWEIWFFTDGDGARFHITREDQCLGGMRIPQYAVTGLAQFFLNCLNGNRLPR